MLAQTELQERLLSELQEAGEENLPTLANTVLSSGEAAGIAELTEALSQLIHSEQVSVAIETQEGENLEELSHEQSQNFIGQLEKHLVWRAMHNSWTGGLRPWPLIVTTNKGKERAQAILDERGYRRWEQKA